MKNKKMFKPFLVTIIVVTVGVISWFSLSYSASKNDDHVIRVGSKNFTESLIISEIYSLALEEEGYQVDRVFNVSSAIIHNSICDNEIDLYPEYTGTGLISILGQDVETDPEKVYDIVKSEYKNQFQLTWLDYAEANDSSGLAMRKETAEKYNIKTISDLQKNADKVRMASQGEYEQREDGLPALEKVYGKFNWKSSKVYDNSLKYQVLENDEADVTPAYTTEGRLAETDKFLVLEDDKQVWPPYNLAPVVRDNLLVENPEIKKILNEVSAKLDTATVTQLNAKVDVDGEEYTDVAKDFYDSLK